LHEAVSSSQRLPNVDDVVEFRITSKQIAEMFESTNAKVVRRIDRMIVPMIDSDSRNGFEKYNGVNVQNKPITFYRLNRGSLRDVPEPDGAEAEEICGHSRGMLETGRFDEKGVFSRKVGCAGLKIEKENKKCLQKMLQK